MDFRVFGFGNMLMKMTLIFCCLAFSVLQADEKDPPSITVTGSAEISVVPDESVLTFSVRSQEEALNAAVADNDAKIKAVIEFLKESKVESRYIRTEVIRIRPVFEDPSPGKWQQSIQSSVPINAPGLPAAEKKKKIKPIGYTATRQLSLTIRELDSFEAIYRGLIEKGVNDVGGIEFRTTELRKHRDDARLKAVKAAKEKADAMAGVLGAKVVGVMTIVEGEQSRWTSPNFMMQNSFSTAGGGADVGGGVAAGMIDITAKVTIVFELGATKFK